MSEPRHLVLTVGHSRHSLDWFLTLLHQHAVTAVVDVRSAPFSRFNPQFNKDTLGRRLETHAIDYVFLGRELGARSDDPSCYRDGRVQYDLLARTKAFHDGLERVIRESRDHRIALMCAEKEPLECHRTVLVARALVGKGVEVAHILADGGLESHEETMLRLLDLLGMPRQDLFRTQDELIEEALSRQAERIAYVVEDASEPPGDLP